MRGFMTGIVLGFVFMVPFALVAGTFEKGQDMIVCIHEGSMNIVITEEECPGETRSGTLVDVSSEHVDVQVGEEVFRVPLTQ
ncbi:hypothetical protein C6366_12695 [Desulfonatronum sp. SC1]|nr:hypothetical protein C6366_12695 [Desulfonatronum sp. SC1]